MNAQFQHKTHHMLNFIITIWLHQVNKTTVAHTYKTFHSFIQCLGLVHIQWFHRKLNWIDRKEMKWNELDRCFQYDFQFYRHTKRDIQLKEKQIPLHESNLVSVFSIQYFFSVKLSSWCYNRDLNLNDIILALINEMLCPRGVLIRF